MLIFYTFSFSRLCIAGLCKKRSDAIVKEEIIFLLVYITQGYRRVMKSMKKISKLGQQGNALELSRHQEATCVLID
jgi:hypothetical protein